MGSWATRRLRSSASAGQGSLLPGPELTVDFIGLIHITWTDPDPDTWVTMSGPTAAGPFTFFDTRPGSDRILTDIGNGNWAYVYGQDATPARTTEDSNIVQEPP